MREKAETDDAIPSIAPGELTSKQFRRSRAMLIQKIYEVDPLCCPNCQNQMRIISILEAGPIVRKILEHLDLWDVRNHDPPLEEDSHILRTRLRRFGLSNPAIRLLGLNPFSHPRKKSKSGIGAELRRETGRFPCFPAFPRISANHFQSIDNLFHSLSDLTATRPPAPVLRRNMLRRRTGAGGRETIEKHGVVSLTKSKFLSFYRRGASSGLPLAGLCRRSRYSSRVAGQNIQGLAHRPFLKRGASTILAEPKYQLSVSTKTGVTLTAFFPSV